MRAIHYSLPVPRAWLWVIAEGHRLGVCLASLKAVVEAAEESVKQVALRSSMSVAGETTTGVVHSSTGGETYGSEGPQIADRGQTVVLNSPM